MERIIKVTGKGKISVKPDRIRLVLDLVGLHEQYEEVMEMSDTQTSVLTDCFERLGFVRADLKTVSFHINTKYEDYQTEDRSWKRRFVGYEFRHSLKVEFDLDNELLGKILYSLAHADITPEFSIIYTVKDVEASKNLLLSKAVEDSKEKAMVLTQAAGVKLGDIVTINYSWDEVEFAVRPMNKMMKPMMDRERGITASYNMDIEPEDIDVSDTVTVVWEIK